MLDKLPANRIKAVFSDLDDTLTDQSQMRRETYDAIWKLKEAGFWTVIVSGRPAGWADCLMRLWPIDAMVFENGAGVMVREADKISTTLLAEIKQRHLLENAFQSLRAKIPHLKLATDQSYRKFDYAIDYCEEPPVLSDSELNLVLKTLAKTNGITHKLSSIHVNYWIGEHTKVTACEYLLKTEGQRRKIGRGEVVYSGDSPNDEPLFEYFEHSVGVANVKKYLAQMKFPPRYLTRGEGGTGFRELAESLVG